MMDTKTIPAYIAQALVIPVGCFLITQVVAVYQPWMVIAAYGMAMLCFGLGVFTHYCASACNPYVLHLMPLLVGLSGGVSFLLLANTMQTALRAGQ
jgi:hypothetical protein